MVLDQLVRLGVKIPIRFVGSHARPLVELCLLRAGEQVPRRVLFLVDTGADKTALSAPQLELETSGFAADAPPATGVIGSVNRWRVPSARIWAEVGDAALELSPTELFLFEALPISLLGRDVMQEYGLTLFLDARKRIGHLEAGATSGEALSFPPG